jgi:hypothetical protein
MPPKSERFEMRMDGDMLAAIDRWRKNMGDISRAEANRMLVRIGLVDRDVTLREMATATASTRKSKKRR